jgi:hypothetical protein
MLPDGENCPGEEELLIPERHDRLVSIVCIDELVPLIIIMGVKECKPPIDTPGVSPVAKSARVANPQYVSVNSYDNMMGVVNTFLN